LDSDRADRRRHCSRIVEWKSMAWRSYAPLMQPARLPANGPAAGGSS
jgi:hypothetical protein